MKLKKIILFIRNFLLFYGIIKEPPLNKQRMKNIYVGSYKLLANKYHSLDTNLEKHKFYSRNLSRLVSYVNSKYKNHIILDVGANIGDSVALIRSNDVSNKIICIEPYEYYFELLKENTRNIKDVEIYNIFLSDSDNKRIDLRFDNGTAKPSLKNDDQKGDVKVYNLDSFININNIQGVKFLKIDTDGFDFKIIKNGLDFVKKNKPILFLEYDAELLKENDENYLSLFESLKIIGYQKIIYYDNYGKMLCSVDMEYQDLINDLHGYIDNYSGAFRYYDICIIHKDDIDLFDHIIKNERSFFKDN